MIRLAFPASGTNSEAMGLLVSAPRILAVLGPTNTGKTHLAIERMLGHQTGMIGFPLRLLARENYDRVVRLKGARAVALITGEEKIVPRQPVLFRLHRRVDAAGPGRRLPRRRRDPALRRPRARPCLHRPPAARPRPARDDVPRRRHHQAAAAPAGARGRVRRPPALLDAALSRPQEGDAPAAAQRRRRFRRRRCLRAGRADAPPARRHRGGAGRAQPAGAQCPGRHVPGRRGRLPGGDRRHRHGPQHGPRPRRLRQAGQVRRPARRAASPRPRSRRSPAAPAAI